MNDRHSQAEQGWIIKDPKARAIKEAENSILQADRVMELAEEWAEIDDCPFNFPVLMELNRIATEGVIELSGVFRPAGIAIEGSKHIPPDAREVPKLVSEMCDYVCKHWKAPGKALHLAAYVMWRINWIHPFPDGNGRTARAASYLVLCANIGTRLPGINTIPEQISKNKAPYYQALEDADEAFKRGETDVSSLERYLSELLLRQLDETYTRAGGKVIETANNINNPHPDRNSGNYINIDNNNNNDRNTGWKDAKPIRWIEGHPTTSIIIATIIAAIIGGLASKFSGFW